MTMIRVLMLNSEFPPLGGGTATANMELLKELSGTKNLHVDLITSGIGKYTEEKFAKNISIHKVTVHKKNLHHFRNREIIEYAFRAFFVARKLCKEHKYNLTFAFCVLPSGLISLHLKRKYGVPYIIRVSGCDIPGFYKRYQWLYPFITPIMKLIWRRADKVITKCDYEKNLLLDCDKKLVISSIPNGIDMQKFSTKLSRKIPKGMPLRILCVARHTKHKGHFDLLKAVKTLTDEGLNVDVDLIGDGQIFEKNKNIASQMGIINRVHFIGALPRDRIIQYYNDAHVFVLPSYNEGMSNAILEAMAAGLPILTTKNCSDELVQHKVNGYLFQWQDTSKLTSYLKALIKNHSLINSMGQSSSQIAQTLRWNKVAKQYNTLFKRYDTV